MTLEETPEPALEGEEVSVARYLRLSIIIIGALAMSVATPTRLHACEGHWYYIDENTVGWIETCTVIGQVLYYTTSADVWGGSTGEMLHVADQAGYGGSLPRCGDERDVIIQEYATYNAGIIPFCHAFTSAGGTQNFSWSELNQATDNTHQPWAILHDILWAGLENTRSNYNRGGIRITSGYRCPHINVGIPGSAQRSRHMYGDAADMKSGDHPWNQDEWNRLADAAVLAGATFIKPYETDTSHVHADWR